MRLGNQLLSVALWISPLACGLAGAQQRSSTEPALSPQQIAHIRGEALDHFYSLEYDAAIADFQKLQANEPQNPRWLNYLSESYLHKELFIAGALDGDLFGASNQFFRGKKIVPDPGLDRQFKETNQDAIRLCERSLKQSGKDEGALYACGVAYAARAMHSGLIERAVVETLSDARKSNEFDEQVMREDPQNYDARLIPGFYQFVVGSLPSPLKLLLIFTGMNGDKQLGIQMVEEVVQKGDGARHDARLLLSVMYRRERRFEDARHTVEPLAEAFPRDYIFPLEIASLWRSENEYQQAIREYETILDKVRNGVPNYPEAPVARVHFELGNLYEITGNPEIALEQYRQVHGSRGSNFELEREATANEQRLEAEVASKKAGL